ncbi:S8/S53 family peptidase [Ottowia sp.]|uniref:S8/S53 family peptidase n=1 Tax=Ottowia sp. TaxID=1898956 RepID=UPI0025DFFC05|nr:S8/S53 family peptidase [Ottowia sp.]MBK6616674.1 S8/S53 family peptidase [Ottowia sp.]
MRIKLTLSLLAAAATLHCNAASFDAAEVARLKADASKFGAAPVMVHLQDVSLDTLRKNPAAVSASTNKKAAALFAQLGPHAWRVGRNVSMSGQATFYVTADGLDILIATGLAKSVFAGQSWHAHAGLSDGGDGSFEEIDARIARDGFVDLVVVPKLDRMKPMIDRSNNVRYVAAAENAQLARGVADQVRAAHGLKSEVSAAAPGLDEASFTVRVDRQGLLALVESGRAIGFKPVGHKDARVAFIDPKVKAAVAKHGSTRVLISMRTAFGGSKMPASVWAEFAAAHKAGLTDIASTIAAKEDSRDLSEFGMLGATITAAELQQLEDANDPRLLSVVSAVPALTPHLTSVNSSMNTNQLRTKGYIATGQNLILMDTGVQKSHPFLMQNGVSKVVYEACFGTSMTQNDEVYTSLCPSKNAAGDSPLGLANSGAAIPTCSNQVPAACSHGTHMAGIMVGKSATINGLAQGANLYSVQVGSQYGIVAPTWTGKTWFFASPEDIAAAIQAVKSAVAPGTVGSPNTIVSGLGGSAYPTESVCNNLYANFGSAVLYLKNAGIATVAASMDVGLADGSHPQMFPACASHVIKVGATVNDGVGNTIWSGTTLFEPTRFPNGQFFLAPGASVVSSVLAGNGFSSYGGTSQSAAAVAALYAVYKAAIPGATVDQITNYLVANAQPVTKSYECGTFLSPRTCTTTFPRVKLPNL